jgi:hypothetical protein
MRCPGCGIVLDPGGQFCGQCGAQSPYLPPRFAEAERHYAALRARHEAGELDEATFHDEVRKLLIADGHGGHWMVGTDGGDWFWYDGRAWVRRDPPPATAEQPPPPVGVPASPAAAAASIPTSIPTPLTSVAAPARPPPPPEAAPSVATAVPTARPSPQRWVAASLGVLAVVVILAAVVWWLAWLSSRPPVILW